MIKQRFTLYVSLALMLLMWALPQSTSAQTIKCTGGMANLDDVKIHIGCGDWYDVAFKGHPGFSYSLSVEGILLGTFSGGDGEYSTGTAKSKFSAGDTITIVQSCDNAGGGTDSDIFRAVLPPDLSIAGTYMFEPDAGSVTNTPWMASEFTAGSPTDIPTLNITGDNGRAWAPSCMGASDGKWTFGATVGDLATYSDLDSLKYVGTVGFTGSGTIVSGETFTAEGLPAGAVAAVITAYSGSCTDTVTVENIIPAGTNEPTVACNDRIYASVDATCMAELHPGMMLAGYTNPCGLALMDSIVLKHENGDLLDPDNIRYRGDTVVIENASSYIHGKPIVAEIHASDGSIANYCWGTIVLEDKLAPVLTCDDRKEISCYQFDGSSTSGASALDCDPDPTINIINETLITDCSQIGSGSPTDSIIKRIIRTYTATDVWGNTSDETCTDTLDIRRLDAITSNHTGVNDPLDLRGLIVPSDRTVDLDTAFVCDSRDPFTDEDGDHIPDPVSVSDGGAGIPVIDTTIDGVDWYFELHPSNYVNVDDNVSTLLERCKTVVTFEDTRLPRVGCVEKVMRRWVITEWVCNHETSLTILQEIEIVDDEGPSFEVPADMKVTTNQKTCERAMTIPAPIDVSDYCKKSDPLFAIVNVYNEDGDPIGTLKTEDGTFSLDGGQINLPLGENEIEYNVYDDCHNVTTQSFYITVVDETAPVAICKEFLTIGISDDGEDGNGEVWIKAEAFDNGSYDDCGLDDMCIARMDDLDEFDALQDANVGGLLDDEVTWYVPLSDMNENASCGRIFESSGSIDGVDYITRDDLCTPQMMICCEDVTDATMVLFRVTDKEGNINECMAEVQAQDKRRPTVHCPPDLTIDCRYDFVMDDMLDIFGSVAGEGEQEAIDLPGEYVLDVEDGKDLIDGVWFGNCDATVEVSVETDINECRQGSIVRTFTVTANNGNTVTCQQTITVSRENALKSEDIVYPADITMTGCLDPSDFTPESTGVPSVDEAECSLVGWAYEDLTVRFNENDSTACFKIIREWTVIDWCKEPSFTIGTGTQVIKVNDITAPTITSSCDEVTETVLDSECEDGPITLTQSASDDCTDGANLQWTVRIDAFNDGDFDITEEIRGETADVSDTYPIGTHRVVWEVRDQCGNLDVCEQLFTIVNIVKPTPICLTDVTGSLMPVDDGSGQNGQDDDDIANDGIADGGMITVWASEYDIESSTHPCGYDLVYSFDSLSVVDSRDFTCSDLDPAATGSGTSTAIPLQVFVLAVEKDHEGNVTDIISSDFCNVIFRLDDNNNTCDDVTFNPANVLITGNVHTELRDNVPTVEVELKGVNNGASTLATETDLGGMYAFGDMPTGGTYNVVPKLNKDILNGVSTLDLVLIQKHILGLERLSSPYKIIAGDVNKDGNISAIDLVELRRVILGVSSEFNNNNSWRFVDEAYEFKKPNDPLNEPFAENYNIAQLSNTMIIDFIGVKVGDVNGNVNVSGLLTAPRSSASLTIEDKSFEAGQILRVPVSFKGVSDVLGYQFTMEYDQTVLRFSGFDSGSLDMRAENFGIHGISEGFITSSWGSVNAKEVKGTEAFVLEFTALSNGSLSQILDITSNVTSSEVYNENSEVMGLNLEFSSESSDIVGGYELFQNTPNPFTQSTSIGFMLAKDAEATINIFDVTGKLVKGYTGSFAKGLNTITIDKGDLNSTGVLYYTLDTKEFTSTRRMVLID